METLIRDPPLLLLAGGRADRTVALIFPLAFLPQVVELVLETPLSC